MVVTAVVTSLLTTAASAWGSVRHVDAIAGDDTGECGSVAPCQTIGYALGRPGSGDEIVVASGTYDVSAPLAVSEIVDLHGVAGDPRPLIRAASGVDAMTVSGAAAGSRFSHLQFGLTGGFLTGFNAAVRATAPATFEDDAFSLTALFGTPDRGRALLVDLPPGTAAPVVLRDATVTADSAVSGQDGAGLVETTHGTLQVRNLTVSNVADGVNAIAGLSAGSETQADDAILDVDGATITTRGRCLGLFGGSSSLGSTLRNLTVSQFVDGPGGSQATVECVRIGSRNTTIDGMKVTANDTSTDAAQYDDAAIEAWQAEDLTLRRLDVASVEPALYAGPPSGGPATAGSVTNLQIHGARMRSLTNSALLIRNGTGRLTDVLAVGGSSSNNAGLRFFPAIGSGNQFALRNVTAIGGTGGSSTAGILIDGAFDRTATVTGRNVIASGSFADIFVSTNSSVTLDHSFVASVMSNTGGVYTDGGNNSAASPGFVNAGAGDYHLAAGANAIDAGATDSFVGTEDFEGDARPAGETPDAGADERRADTLPDTTITSAPPASGTDPTPTFRFVADDAGATFTCSVTGGSEAACTSPVTSAALADGVYTFTVTASNATGADPTPATFQFRVDRTPPDTNIDAAGPANDSTPSFELTSVGEPAAGFACALDGAALASCSGSYVAPTLSDGDHTLTAQAHDAAGNPDPTPAVLSFTIDTQAPNTEIGSGAPTQALVGAALSIPFSSAEPGATFECSLGGATPAPCTSPAARTAPGQAGQVVFKVAARDAAGNQDPTPAALSIDVRDPTPVPAPTPAPTPTAGPPAVDRTAPKLVLTITRSRLRAALSKGVRLKLRSDEAATGTIAIQIPAATVRKLKLGRKAITFARGTARISRAGSVSFRFKPKPSLRRRLARQRRLTLRVVVRVKDGAGNAASVTRALKLTR